MFEFHMDAISACVCVRTVCVLCNLWDKICTEYLTVCKLMMVRAGTLLIWCLWWGSCTVYVGVWCVHECIGVYLCMFISPSDFFASLNNPINTLTQHRCPVELRVGGSQSDSGRVQSKSCLNKQLRPLEQSIPQCTFLWSALRILGQCVQGVCNLMTAYCCITGQWVSVSLLVVCVWQVEQLCQHL